MKTISNLFKGERKLFSDTFLWFITMSIISTIIIGILFYIYTTFSMVSNFNSKTRKTAYEISEILSGSMYNVDNEAVIKNAKIYLLSGSLSGIEIHSSTEGLLIKKITNENSLIEPITVDLSHNNIFLGTSKFWFDDAEIKNAQKMEALGTLSGGLAHDFNNTLVGITAPLSLMEFNFRDTEFHNKNKFNEYLSIMKKSADRAAGIINQLLSIAKKQDFNSSKINLNELLNDLIRFSESTIDKSIEIIFKPYKEPAFINGDSNQIEQVILNLIVNSSHSMTFMRDENQKWGGLLEIKIERFTPDDFFLKINPNMEKSEYWHIDIKDSGIGISKENIQKIFNPFFTTKTNGKGTGLGLSMVYNIINQHNGHINVYSEPGSETIFNIYLPVLNDNDVDKAVPAYNKKEQAIRKEGTIMVIDDEEDVRKTVRIMLETCGYKTYVSDDSRSGVDFFKNNYKDIDAVILDFSMPGSTGREVFLELIKIDPDVKVLLSSGFGLDERTTPLLDLGIKDFLKKPYTFEQLIETLDRIILR